MKIKPQNADNFCNNPSKDMRLILTYGPDNGLVRERGQILCKNVVDDINDPFNVTVLRGSELKESQAALIDSAHEISLMGGRRLVNIREGNEKISHALSDYLTSTDPLPNPDCTIIVEMGDLKPSSSMRKLCEKSKNAAAIACYADDERAIASQIEQALRIEGKNIDHDAKEWLAAHLTGDRGLMRQAIEKLIIYVGNEKTVSQEHAEAIIGDGAAISFEKTTAACFSGNSQKLDIELERLFTSKTSPIAILRIAQNHNRRLQEARAHMEDGLNAGSAMAKLRPPVFFKAKASFTQQLNSWTMPKLIRAQKLLLTTEAQCKQTGMPDTTLCSRALILISRLAQTGQQRRGRYNLRR